MVVDNKQIDIEIDRKNVRHYLGYSADGQPPARILGLIDEYIENVYHLIEPSYSYVIRDIERVQGSRVLVEGPIVFHSEVIARLLGECHKAAVLVATIGTGLEKMASHLAEDGLILQASVLDAIGSDAVEKVADLVHGMVGEEATADGLVTSRRFSPGYCDWDISQQMMVFRAVKRDSIDVHLTDKCLMIPQKSLTGLIGIGPPDGNVMDYNPCGTCDQDDCRGRR